MKTLDIQFSQWLKNSLLKKRHLSIWLVSKERVSYFKSLFYFEKCKGLGLKLSQLKKIGSTAMVTNFCKEPPQNSSFRNSTKMGFQKITNFPNFWKDVDYFFGSCSRQTRICHANEMIQLAIQYS